MDKTASDSLFHWLDARGFRISATHAAALHNLVEATDPFIRKLEAVVSTYANEGASFEGGAIFNREEALILQQAVKILERTRNLEPLLKVEEPPPPKKIKRLSR